MRLNVYADCMILSEILLVLVIYSMSFTKISLKNNSMSFRSKVQNSNGTKIFPRFIFVVMGDYQGLCQVV